ncbi:MAG TPA: hypothetical protein VF045_11895 [Acidimicrobiales bacterium]
MRGGGLDDQLELIESGWRRLEGPSSGWARAGLRRLRLRGGR